VGLQDKQKGSKFCKGHVVEADRFSKATF